jgi:hypothetical protein
VWVYDPLGPSVSASDQKPSLDSQFLGEEGIYANGVLTPLAGFTKNSTRLGAEDWGGVKNTNIRLQRIVLFCSVAKAFSCCC